MIHNRGMRLLFNCRQKLSLRTLVYLLYRLIVANSFSSYIPTIFVTWHDEKLATGCYNRLGARRKRVRFNNETFGQLFININVEIRLHTLLLRCVVSTRGLS